ncbi:MAG: phosphoenolpyruvate carboxylase [Actinobacteria bacterium]|nr:phosphoenolpyruvate carboxylase [Actinomycetota bacterium]
MRSIPTTMATQHPDNACAAFWLGKSFIDSRDEVKECLVAFEALGCHEFMWDWEGKYVDEAVIERVFEEDLAYFRKKALGRDIFLTYRLPNIWVEKGSYRILRAFANILAAHDIAKDIGLHCPPVFEIILPMTTSADQLVYLQGVYSDFARLIRKDPERRIGSGNPPIIEIIPLVEDIPDMMGLGDLIRRYVSLYRRKGLARIKELEYVRPFIARSDPALNYGLVPAVLGAKVGLSRAYRAAEESGLEVYPIIGCGSVPFRGNLSPLTVKRFLEEYPGVRTATVQSSFRYDHPAEDVTKAVKALNRVLAKGSRAPEMSGEEARDAEKLIAVFKKHYRATIIEIAPLIIEMSRHIPRRRERRLHTGLFGYSREITKGVSLPRAITFTASLYSLGIPPEVIGTGRALREAFDVGLSESLSRLYVNLKRDAEEACAFVNRENIARLKGRFPALAGVEEDLKWLEGVLGIQTEPSHNKHLIHRNMTSNILLLLEEGRNVSEMVEETAVLRGFMG